MNVNMKDRLVRLVRNNMPWFILLVVAVIFSFSSSNFFSLQNIINILNQNAYVIVCSIGITFIMMAGQIDLSVGYQMSLIGVSLGILVKYFDPPVWVLLLAGILMGVVLCELNMILAVKLRITLLMVTVSTSMLYQGISYTVSGSKTLSGFSDSFKFISQGYIGSIPFAVILTLVLVVIMSIFLTKTYWGTYIYALGGNEDAARLAGISVTAAKMMIGAIAGIFVGLSSIMLVARVGTAQSGVGPGTEFTVITGILLGGVSARGGEGRLSGVVAGILIMAILGNGMQLGGWGVYLQYVAKGIIMLVAIGVDVYQYNHRKIIVDKLPGPEEESPVTQ